MVKTINKHQLQTTPLSSFLRRSFLFPLDHFESFLKLQSVLDQLKVRRSPPESTQTLQSQTLSYEPSGDRHESPPRPTATPLKTFETRPVIQCVYVRVAL